MLPSTSIWIVLIPVADPGEGPGVPSPLLFICRPNWGPKGKKMFLRPPLNPPPPPRMPLYWGVVSPGCLWEIVAWERSPVFNWVCVWRHLFFKVEVEMFPSERCFFFLNMNSVYRTLNAQLTHQMDDKEIGSFHQAPELTDYLSDCESYIKTKNGLAFLKRKKLWRR